MLKLQCKKKTTFNSAFVGKIEQELTEYFLLVSVVPNRLIWGELLEMGHALQLNLSLN
jgi:hypothetical protein